MTYRSHQHEIDTVYAAARGDNSLTQGALEMYQREREELLCPQLRAAKLARLDAMIFMLSGAIAEHLKGGA